MQIKVNFSSLLLGPLPPTSFTFNTNILLSKLFPLLNSSLPVDMKGQVSLQYKATGKFQFFLITFFDTKEKDRIF